MPEFIPKHLRDQAFDGDDYLRRMARGDEQILDRIKSAQNANLFPPQERSYFCKVTMADGSERKKYYGL